MSTSASSTRHSERRTRLGRIFGNTLFLISAGHAPARSHSVRHRFQATADASWLWGDSCGEDQVLVIAGAAAYLAERERSAEELLWDGGGGASKREGDGLERVGLAQLETVVRSHVREFDRVAWPIGIDASLDALALRLGAYDRAHRSRAGGRLELCDSRALTGLLRSRKDPFEIAMLREAGRKSSRAHALAMASPLEGRSERELANFIEAKFLHEGMSFCSYESIVGSGSRSTILHVRATERRLSQGELLLVDAGGQFGGYCADITRSFPVGPKFSPAQRDIYEIVLHAQREAVRGLAPGLSLDSIDTLTKNLLEESLARLGIAESTATPGRAISEFMPHSTSHWMGLDVHDPCPYFDDAGNPTRLEEGMVFTVEPGLYFRPGLLPFDSPFLGIGVRVEDDVVITTQGVEELTDAPREIEEIEALRAAAQS